MKTLIITCLLILSGKAYALSPADQDVKNYVTANMNMVYELSSTLYMSADVNFDDNMTCFSSYSHRKEIGVCRVSGGAFEDHSTFLIIVREQIPGDDRSDLVLEVLETSRIQL